MFPGVKYVITDSGGGLSPVRRQAFTLTMYVYRTPGTIFSELLNLRNTIYSIFHLATPSKAEAQMYIKN